MFVSAVFRRVLISQTRGITNEANDLSLVHVAKQFEGVESSEKNKERFLASVALFKEKRGRSHVEFINTALKYLKDYGVHKDLEVYKTLLDVFPKGKMIPQTAFQKIFLHYPMQQNCCVKVLDEMEWHGVQPDKEIHDIVVNAFGEWNFATKKVKRMLYWMPKLKHSNKYLDRRHVEGKSLTAAELAGIALRMMSRDSASSVSLLKLSDIADSEAKWMATSQSPSQKALIEDLNNGEEVFVDTNRVYVQEYPITYVTLTVAPTLEPMEEFKNEKLDEDYTGWFEEWKKGRSDAKRSIHEQNQETVLAIGALYKTDDTVCHMWIDHLLKTNPNLKNLRIRVRLGQKIL